ncbi:ACT7 [Forsythia ovata]|uniref:ACT7 n=1 Tax=Forsythia ovata TaxID=205694 RepID=A0ABD1XCP5_9LAMI
MLNPKLHVREIQKKHKNEFAGWFKECIRTANNAKQSIHAELGMIAEDSTGSIGAQTKMSQNYDNWERLVEAVLQREQYWQMAHDHSRSPSISSTSSDFRSSFNLSSSTDNVPADIWRAEGSSLYELNYQQGTAYFKDVQLNKNKIFFKNFIPNLVFLGGNIRAFEVGDILRSPSEVLGTGTFGTTYKVTLDDGTTIALKKLKETSTEQRKFEQQMKVFRSLKHKNVAAPKAYYFSRNMKLVIHDYQIQGSVSELLHGNIAKKLPKWETRLRIAIGAARGIAYIHTKLDGKLVHGNIKASNTFLNSQQYGCVSEFGLGEVAVAVEPFLMHNAGYLAPECTVNGKLSQASDVYSFGVLLLELITGMSPIEGIGVNKVPMVTWVIHTVKDKGYLFVLNKLAPSSSLNANVEKEDMLLVAMSCLAENPKYRPDMTNVLQRVENIPNWKKYI